MHCGSQRIGLCEGRPEDYITKTTGFELPGEAGAKLETISN